MRNPQSEQRAGQSRGVARLGRGTGMLCVIGLLIGIFIFGLGACQFGFGSSSQTVSQGLDTMSDGILVALVAVSTYVGFFALSFLIANLFDGNGVRGRA